MFQEYSIKFNILLFFSFKKSIYLSYYSLIRCLFLQHNNNNIK